MDTSVTLIGIAITILIGIPLIYALRSSAINKAKIKAIMAQHSYNNVYSFSRSESQNKKVLAIDEKNKGFLLIDFNPKPEETAFINLNMVDSCELVETTEANSRTVVRIEFEFRYKDSRPKESAPFYRIEHDQMTQVCLHEDRQLAQKWQQIIKDCISS